MRTTLSGLNDYLFEELDRLTNEDLTKEELEKEIKRSDAVQKVAKVIIENANVVLQAKKHMDEYGQGGGVDMFMLEDGNAKK